MKTYLLATMFLCLGLYLNLKAQLPADLQHAKWIAMQADSTKLAGPGIDGAIAQYDDASLNGFGMAYRMPVFRKEVVLKKRKSIKHAEISICGLGQFELFVNGKKIGDHFLDPGWTLFDKEALYVKFCDIPLQKGKNLLTVMLGNGFYNIPRERYYKLLQTYGAPKMILRLTIHYKDGSTQEVCSDASWQVAESPITYSSIFGGEDYDARVIPSNWQQALEVASPTQQLLLQPEETAVKLAECIPPKKTFLSPQGHWTYDLGQNFAGVISVKLRNTCPGQEVIFRPGELLENGCVSQRGTGSPYYFKYTCRGDSVETWQPQFSYYGFRYVQVEGAVPQDVDNPNALPILEILDGWLCTSTNTTVGTFECSNDLFNRTFTLIDWAIRSNVQSVTTDCPTREKLGWQEQNHLMQHSLMYRYEMLPFLRKVFWDIEHSQWNVHACNPKTGEPLGREGCIPTVCPEYVRFDINSGFEDTPEWGSSFILCPWYTYLWYGDTAVVADHYEAMKQYIRYLKSRSKDDLLDYGLGDWFDIGPRMPGRAQLTSVGCSASAMYYYDVNTMAQAAHLLGKADDEEHFRTLASRIRRSYNARYFNVDSCYYDRNSQTANAMSLYMGLVEEEHRQAVLDHLVADIHSRGNALTAGDVGYRYVLRALEEGGRSDVIFDMNARTDVPGYGWQLEHGATALTESWQAYAGVSNNHLMLGHLMEWFFSGLGGIHQQERSVGWRHIIINPQMVGDVTWANTTFKSPQGMVTCHWTCTPDRQQWTLEGELPEGTDGVVVLPTHQRIPIAAGHYRFTNDNYPQ